MAVIKPEHGVNLNPKEPLSPKDKAIFAVVILAFLAAMFAVVGWLIGFDKVITGVLTAVFLVAVTFLVVGIGWGLRKLFELARR